MVIAYELISLYGFEKCVMVKVSAMEHEDKLLFFKHKSKPFTFFYNRNFKRAFPELYLQTKGYIAH